MNYQPHPDDQRFLLDAVLGATPRLRALGPFAEFDDALQAQVLDEAGKFVAEVVAPLNRIGDETGCRVAGGVARRAPASEGGLGRPAAGAARRRAAGPAPAPAARRPPAAPPPAGGPRAGPDGAGHPGAADPTRDKNPRRILHTCAY